MNDCRKELTPPLQSGSEKAIAPHSSTLAWKIPWTEEPGGLQSMGLPRVGHNWATSLSLHFTSHGNRLPCSSLENPRDRGAWWAAIHGVTQSWTRLKQHQQQQQQLQSGWNQEMSDFAPSPFSIKEAWILTQARWFFGTWVHHLLCQLAFCIKSLFLFPTSRLSTYWPVGWQTVRVWTAE